MKKYYNMDYRVKPDNDRGRKWIIGLSPIMTEKENGLSDWAR
jgi:hypothetical protein